MKLKVELFATARDLAGASSVEVTVTESASVVDLKTELAKQFPELSEIVSRSAISVDLEYAANDKLLVEGSEVALIPPVSGG